MPGPSHPAALCSRRARPRPQARTARPRSSPAEAQTAPRRKHRLPGTGAAGCESWPRWEVETASTPSRAAFAWASTRRSCPVCAAHSRCRLRDSKMASERVSVTLADGRILSARLSGRISSEAKLQSLEAELSLIRKGRSLSQFNVNSEFSLLGESEQRSSVEFAEHLLLLESLKAQYDLALPSSQHHRKTFYQFPKELTPGVERSIQDHVPQDTEHEVVNELDAEDTSPLPARRKSSKKGSSKPRIL